MARATVTSKGQVTIPKKIRDRLGINVGDRFEFVVDEEGNLVGTPLRTPAAGSLAGCLRHLAGDEPVTLAEMDEAIRRGASERDLEARRRKRRADRSGSGGPSRSTGTST